MFIDPNDNILKYCLSKVNCDLLECLRSTIEKTTEPLCGSPWSTGRPECPSARVAVELFTSLDKILEANAC